MSRVTTSAPRIRQLSLWRIIPAARRDKVLRDGALLAVSAGVSSLLMLGYQVFVARELQPAAYSTFGALLGLIAIVSQGGNALQLTAARDVARLTGSSSEERVSRYIVSSLLWSAIFFFIALVVLLPFSPLVADLLGISTPWLLVLALGAGAGYVPLSTLRGNLQGLQRFRPLSLNRIGEKVVLIAVGGGLVAAGYGIEGALIGLAVALFAMLVYGAYGLRDHLPRRIPALRRELIRPSVIILLTTVGVALLANVDALIAKSIFTDDDAGVFNAIGRLGKVMFFVALAFNRALFPKSARLSAEGKPAIGIMIKGLAVVALGSLVVIPLSVPLAGPFLSATLGDSYAGSPGLVSWYLIAMSLVAMVAIVQYYSLSLGSRMHLWPLGLGVAVLLGLFIIEPGSMFHLIASMIATFTLVLVISLAITFTDLKSGESGRSHARSDGSDEFEDSD